MNYPPFDPFPELVSGRLLLRELHPSDASDLVEIFTYNGKPATDEADVTRMLGLIHDNYLQGEGINWGITDKQTGEVIGTCGYYRGFPNATGEIGFILRSKHYRKGYMAEALRLIIAFGQQHLQLDRIIAVTKPANTAAIRLLGGLGFESTGPWEDEKSSGVYTGYVYNGTAAS